MQVINSLLALSSLLSGLTNNYNPNFVLEPAIDVVKNPNYQVSTECRNFFEGLLLRLSRGKPTAADYEVWSLSFKNINSFGLQRTCEGPRQNYQMIMIQGGIDILRFSFGLCIPKVCTRQDLISINKSARKYVKDASKYQPDLEKVIDYFWIYFNTTHYYKEQFSLFDPLLLIALILFVSVCILSLAALTYNLVKNKKRSLLLSVTPASQEFNKPGLEFANSEKLDTSEPNIDTQDQKGIEESIYQTQMIDSKRK